MRDAGTYVYAIGRGSLPSSFTSEGIDGADTRTIRSPSSGDLWAVASDAPRGQIEVTRTNIRAHSDTVQEAFDEADAVLPLQFGTVYPDDDSVRETLLAGRASDLEPLLERVERRAELRLKAYYDEPIVLREVVAEHREIRELDRRTRAVSGDAAYYDRIRLGELVAGAIAVKRGADAAGIVSRLAPVAVEAAVDERLHGEWAVVAASFLVERSRLREFERTVERVRRALGDRVRLRSVGPLPPYSFVSALPEAVART